jgi:KaiC/GvpD/RAD55 family RecA-like ATPase
MENGNIATGIKEFDRIIGGGIPRGKVILIEEEFGGVKSIFAQRVAVELANKNGKTLYVTQRPRKEIEEQMHIYGMEFDARIDIETTDKVTKSWGDYDLIIIENFSILFVERKTKEIVDLIADLREKAATVLILSDKGILDRKQESVIRAMVDGVIQFRFETEGVDRIRRSIVIPKFSHVIDEIIPFKVDGSGISIDTRRRI